ncbi:hypothetical protein F5B20DRAFT_46700 [Whalleya microplaca]|nr:hypothetical protein F5B20DRAFT_46700 [Whalleya microplaca]
MDSPASARGRGRSSARKRHTFPAPSSSQASFQKPYESIEQAQAQAQAPAGTPAANGTASSSFTFETPSPSASRGTRVRMNPMDNANASPEDPNSKGGRSLRKRARVDYTFTQDDEDESYGAKATPGNARAIKKRKTEPSFIENETDEDFDARVKRRASEQPQPSSVRRRNQARKTTVEPQTYVPDQQMEDVEVQDTIEVGGHHSEMSDESVLRRTSSGSSNSESRVPVLDASQSTLDASQSNSEVGQLDRKPLNQGTAIGDEVKRQRREDDMMMDIKTDLADVIDPVEHNPYAYLTPYIEGARVSYPTIYTQPEPEPDPDAVQEDGAEEEAEVAVEETPAGSPGAADTAANSPAAEPEPTFAQSAVRKQYYFKQAREASEFTDLLEDFKSLPQEEAYRRLDVVNRALVAWQKEFNELRKITDDEDNAVRYRHEEESFQHRKKMALSRDPNANPVRKDFVIKGIKAEKPDSRIAYARQQDKIMANAYMFEYDDKEAKIGEQDPIAQRGGVGKGRLRDRPRQTAKAAEADDANVVHGKRSRKPPAPFDGGEAPSRGSTPAPAQQKRRRGPQPAAEKNGEQNAAAPAAVPEPPAVPETPKKKGKGGRPRKHPLPPPPIPEEAPAPAPEPEPEAKPEPSVEEAKPTRKRRRRAPAVKEDEEEAEAPMPNGTSPQAPRRRNSRITEVPSGSFYSMSSMPSTNAAEESRPPTSSSTATVETVASNSYQLREKRQKKFSLDDGDDAYAEEPKPKRVRRASKKVQNAAASAPTPVPAPVPPPPPPPMEPEAAPAPKPKPVQRIKLKLVSSHTPASAPASTPTSNPPSLPASSHSTPAHMSNGNSNGFSNGNGNGNGNGMGNGVAEPLTDGEAALDPNKDYNSMTKSEKMSYSMKARWASGSMGNAVAKRRATLAAKKQAVKTTTPEQTPEVGAGVGVGSGVSSAPMQPLPQQQQPQ